jgi:hypothetical protein
MLLDRNLFARTVELARGSEAAPDHRTAAAVMAFAQCVDIELEPALAVIEGLASQTEGHTTHELALFFAANNLHPSEFADVALGRSRRLRSGPLPVDGKACWAASTQQITEYSFVYPLVLKIGLIELEGGPMPDRMRRFLDWTCETWYFSAAATILAAMCFSGAAPRGVLKSLRDNDRSRALKGLRNCAWDLTYVTCWGELLKRQNQEDCLHLFCSLDKALLRIAQLMLVEPHVSDAQIAATLREFLGASIYDHYRRVMERKDDPARPANRIGQKGADATQRVVAELEQRIILAV